MGRVSSTRSCSQATSHPRSCSIGHQVRFIMARTVLISKDGISGGMGSMLSPRPLAGRRERGRGFGGEECRSVAKKAANIMEALERDMTF
jgi:hypothetical protein